MSTTPIDGELIAILTSKNYKYTRLNVIGENNNLSDPWEHDYIAQVPTINTNGSDQLLNSSGNPDILITVEKAPPVKNISINIDSVNKDFAPGLVDLKVNYSIDKELMEEIKNHADQKIELKIIITDKDSTIIHTGSKEPAAKDSYTWNGITQEGKTIISDETYKVILILTAGAVDIKSIEDINKIIKEDKTGIVCKAEKTFTLGPRYIEWVKYKNMQIFLLFEKDPIKKFNNYLHLYNIYMTYDGVKEAGNPFEYIKQNTEVVSFLGKKGLMAHKEFAIVLRKVEDTLKQKDLYDYFVEKYKKSSATLVMRTVNNPGGSTSVSEHGFGMAIDMCDSKNPQILGSNKLVRFFIKKSTGFDLGIKNTVSDIKNAHDKFKALYANTDNSGLHKKYSEIQQYNNDKETLKLEDLRDIDNQLKELRDKWGLAKNSSPLTGSSEMNHIQGQISSIINKANKDISFILERYINTVVFSDEAKIAISKIKSLYFWHIVTGHNYYSPNVDIVIKEVNNFMSDIKLIKNEYQNLEIFGKDLITAIGAIGYGNTLLKDGFCDIESEIIEAFLKSDPRIEWGGTYTHKIDAMHFGFTKKAAKEIVNKK